MATVYPSPIIYGRTSTTSNIVSSLKSDFGDGYQEVTADGINHIKQTGVLVHPLIPLETDSKTIGATELRDFLKSVCGTSNVVWIKNYMVDPTGDTATLVYLDSWSEAYDGVLFTFNVKYREAFND